MTYRVVRALVRLALRVFFRRLEIVGRGHVPRSGPLLLLSNHVNGLVDPLLLIALCDRPLRIVAKHTLWDVPALGGLLRALRAIPVYRRGEDPEARRRNEAFFRICVEELARGGAVALFPEGKSHSEPAPLPLRTGAARVALAARSRGAPPAVVPVGLNYAAKERFRSDLVVLVGFPVPMESPGAADGIVSSEPAADLRGEGESGEPGTDEGETGRGESREEESREEESREEESREIRLLTRRLSRALAELVVGLGTWEEHRLLALLVELSSPTADGEEELRRRLAFAKGYAALATTHAAELARLSVDLQRLADRCRALRIPPGRLEQRYTPVGVGRYVLTRVELLLALPLGLWGLVNNYLPYRATGWVASRLSKDSDHVAMFKLLGAILLFPAFYLLQAFVVGAILGAPAAVLYLLLLAPAGYYALRYWELGSGFRDEAALLLRMLARRADVEVLRRERQAVLLRVDALARELDSEGAVRP